MSPTRTVLEAALVANPNDLALHAAYADLLIEEGDPRGEFVRLQLALEDPDLPADRRAAMQSAADEILGRHEAEWLGPLKWYAQGEAFPGEPPAAVVKWRRGWIDEINITTDLLSVLRSVNRCPTVRLVRTVTALDDSYLWFGHEQPSFFFGLTQTTVKHLLLTVPNAGDRVIDELIRSGLFARLFHLDLRRSGVTDDGALALAACPDVRRLKSLTLDGNLISPIGVAALAEVGVRVGPQFWDAGRGDHHV